MFQFSQFIQGFSYYLAKWLDKRKQDTPILWLGTTLVLILILLGIHFDWFLHFSEWLKMTIEGFIVGTLSVNGSRTTSHLNKPTSHPDQELIQISVKEEIVENTPVYEVNKPIVEEIEVKEPLVNFLLKRHTFNLDSTLGDLTLDGRLICQVIEDKDRGLKQEMDIKEIMEKKIYKETCIPMGTYQIVVSYSNKFKKFLPELLEVKGFNGIRIHPGSNALQSWGCLLPVRNSKGEKSREAFNDVLKIILENFKSKKIFITITN